MKFALVALFVSCIAAAIGVADEDAAKFIDACRTEVGVDEEVCKKVQEGVFDDPKLPEFFFCVFKKMGYLNDAGEYEVNAIKKGLAEKYDADVANSLADKCIKETKESGPHKALNLAKCYHDNAPKE